MTSWSKRVFSFWPALALTLVLMFAAAPSSAFGYFQAEGEAAVLTGNAATATTYGGYAGIGYVTGLTAVNDSLAVTMQYEADGVYNVVARYANGSGSAKTLTLYLDGAAQRRVSFPATGSWTTWQERIVPIPVTAGVHSLKYGYASGDSGNINVDYITTSAVVQTEPEEGVFSGGASASAANAGYFQTGYATGFTATGASVKNKMHHGDPGDYEFSVFYANGSGSAKTLSLYIDNTFAQTVTFPATASWTDWRRLVFVVNNVPSGTIDVEWRKGASDSGNVNLDSYLAHPAERYEAENGTTAGGATGSTANAGYSGAGYVTGFTAVNDAVTITRYSEPMHADLGVRYANGNAGSRTLSLYVNGVFKRQISFEPTGGWSSWSTKAIPAVYLASGANTIQFKLDSGDYGGVSLDLVEFSGSGQQEAEAGMLTSPAAAATTFSGYSGAGYVSGFTATNAAVSFSHTFGASGNFRFVIPYSNAQGASRTLSLYIDGVFNQQIAFSATASGNDWSDAAVGAYVAEGTRTVELRRTGSDNGGIQVDAFRIVYEPPTEAETFTLAGNAYTDGAPYSGFSGSGYVMGFFAVNDAAGKSFHFGANDDYNLTFRYANAWGANRTLDLLVDGSYVKTLTFQPTNDWSTWSELTERVYLTAGNHTIQLKYRSGNNGGVFIDSMKTRPTALFEFEAGTYGTATVGTTYARYSGAGYLTGFMTNGAYAKTPVYFPASTDYDLVVRYTNGQGASRTMALYIDNTFVRQVTIPATSSWGVWAEFTEKVTLTAGVHDIELRKRAADSGGIAIDYVRVRTNTDASWATTKAAAAPDLYATADYNAPQILPIATSGWEDSPNISQNGTYLYSAYFPADAYSMIFNAINGVDTFENFFLYGRGPTLGIDLDTVPSTAPNAMFWYHSEIIYASRASTAVPFGAFALSGMARPVWSESGPQPQYAANGSVEKFVYMSNEGTFDGSIPDAYYIPASGHNPSGTPVAFPAPVRTDYEEGNPELKRLDADNLVLFFESASRPGTIGGIDIWYSTSADNGGTWTVPSQVMFNTTLDEEQPFLYKDGSGDWWIYYTSVNTANSKEAIYRAKQVLPNNWSIWTTPELLIDSGNTIAIGEPTVSANGDLYFAAGYLNASGNFYDRYDLDTWVLPHK